MRAGILDRVNEDLLQCFPPGVEIVRYDTESDRPIEVDFLVPPTSKLRAEQVFRRVKRVEIVQAISAGVEWLVPLIPPGTILANAQGLHNAITAEWAVTAILASLKYIPYYAEQQRQGRWGADHQVTAMYRAIHQDHADYGIPVLVEELWGKTVLILGYGAIGKAIEDRLAAFGVTILRVARTPREGVAPVSDLHALLPQADVVVVITPLTEQTRHLMDAAAIARMKQGALLVNAARGGVVHTRALLSALTSGSIRAAIDVTDPEPLPQGHPLWHAPNLLITPHVAGSDPRFLRRVYDFVGEQLARYLRGEPVLNVITGDY